MLGAVALFSYGRRMEAFALAGATRGVGSWRRTRSPITTSVLLLATGCENSSASVNASMDKGRRSTPSLRSTASTSFERAIQKARRRAGRGVFGRSETGSIARQGFANDIDEFTLDYVRYYRTIVLRRSPVASRPPTPYERTFSGRFYEVWQRDPAQGWPVEEHLSAGDRLERGRRSDCRTLAALSRRPRAARQVAFSDAEPVLTIIPAQTAFQPGWFVDPTDGWTLRPVGPGKIVDSVVVLRPGTYDLWIEGSFGRGYEVLVDGHPIGRIEYELNGRGAWSRVGDVLLSPGRHVVTLMRGGGDLRPGNGLKELLGPIGLVRRTRGDREVREVPLAKYQSLCNRTVDWLEITR